MSETEIILNKPKYLGFCTVDIYNTYLYDIDCNHI